MPLTPALPESVELPGIVRVAGRITLDYMAETDIGPLLFEGGNFRDHLASVIPDADALVPQGTEWRIHITGDIIRSVNELDPAYANTPYTVDRGANTVAGKTITQEDGTFDVLFSTDVWGFYESESMEQSVADMMAGVRHSFMHEAGHVAIGSRGEDTLSIFPTIDHLDSFEATWSRHLGFMLEDYRIEVALAEVAPAPRPWVGSIGRDLAHFDSERSRSHKVGIVQGDLVGGRNVMIEAVLHVTRALAYLAAETGDPTPQLTGDNLERWNRLIAPTWPEWVAIYGLAAPANESMTNDAIADLIKRLSVLAPDFMRSVGFDRRTGPKGESVWWLGGFDW